MNIVQPFHIDTFKEEYHLNENESLEEARDMMKYKLRKNPNRPRKLHPDELLTDEEEQNEQFAQQIANTYGLIYINQCGIGAVTDSQMIYLKQARKELIDYGISVGEIRHPFTPDSEIKWIFTFDS